MISEKSLDVARRATKIYESQLRHDLETKHLHAFIAIEPDSGECFLGETLSEAIQAARARYPERLAFALRVGHPSAVHLGVLST